MTISANVFPNLNLVAVGQSSTLKLASDTLKVGLCTAATAFTWNSTAEAVTTVTTFLAGSGAGALSETSGGGYQRNTLGSVSLTNSGLYTTLTCANITWSPTATWSAAYAFFYDYTAGGNSDSNGIMLGYWDLGGASTVNAGGTFQLTIATGAAPAGGLLVWSAS